MLSTHTIGLITYEFSSHYHTPLIQMLQGRLRERGYRLLGILGTPCEIAAAGVAFERIDGWLVINTTAGIEQFQSSGKPLVLIGGVSPEFPCVVPDNHGGTAVAITHLIAQGRTRIAFVTNSINPDFRERYAAYCATLADHGLAPDPALVLDTQSYLIHDAHQAVRRLIASGQHVDGVFCANDWLAFGAMQAIQEAGWRIPEDVAVVGFDDIAEAQFATPPLTSVRQNFTELGRIAVELLLDQIEHGIVPQQRTTAPTALITRRSSMAAQRAIVNSQHTEGYCAADWQTRLARDLAQQLIFPIPLTPDTPVAQVWPGVEALVATLAAVLEGSDGPQDVLADVWEQAHRLTRNREALTKVVELLRRASIQRIGGADTDAMDRLTRWLLACQEEVMQQLLMANVNQAERDRQIFMSESLLLGQVGSTGTSPRLIDWVSQSHADWAMLGLWHNDDPDTGERVLDISSVYDRDVGALPSRLQLAPEHFPPTDALPALVRDSLEYMIKLTPLVGNGRQWGYLAYAERPLWTFSDMVVQRSAYITNALEREELLESLRERQRVLQMTYERERSLADTIRELGCPIIPLLKGVLLVPLVGMIDQLRAAEIIKRVLKEVSRVQAEQVLLDITGVPMVDTEVATALIQTAQAVGLLGAKMTLVGVRPEIAQSIVGLGVNLSIFETRPVLAAALSGLIRR